MLRFSMAGVLAVAGLLGCGGDQRSGSVPADSTRSAAGDTSAVAFPDTARQTVQDTATATKPDTTRPGTVTMRRDTGQRVASKPAPRQRSTPRPTPVRRDTSIADTTSSATPAPPARSDSGAAAAASAETTATVPTPAPASAPAQSNQANAPLRDQYHRAPLDTVPQQVYDGWKQYNLNCARCHGEDVQGTTIAPHLIVSMQPGGPINSKELFVQTVCAGRPAKGMPAWCALGMEMPTIDAIYAYVKGRSDAKLRPGRPALRAGG
jgi:hypothetical protein